MFLWVQFFCDYNLHRTQNIVFYKVYPLKRTFKLASMLILYFLSSLPISFRIGWSLTDRFHIKINDPLKQFLVKP